MSTSTTSWPYTIGYWLPTAHPNATHPLYHCVVKRRHPGPRLSINHFAERAGLNPSTLRGYLTSRRIATHPVPAPCGVEEVSGRRWWCAEHADAWIGNRPRAKQPRKDPV